MKFLLILALTSCVPHFSHAADESYTFIVKKQEQKKSTKWSLSEWLETKEKFRLMDMWLAMHSPSPYEFFLGYDYLLISGSGSRITAGAYATIFGLEGRYETQPYGDWTALFKLRFFGYHVQGTHMSLGIGARGRSDAFGSYRNPVANFELALYLSRFFGLQGIYEYYLASTPRNNGSSVTGSRLNAEAFIDFSFFRVGAGYYTESSSDSAPLITGYTLGGKIFF